MPRDPEGGALLTARQLEVLELVAKGLTNSDIARVLGIAPATAKNHVAHVLAALDVANRTEAAGLLHDLQLDSDATYSVPGFGSRPALAVLPFDDFSEQTREASFADGLTEDLTTRLACWRWFPVIARNSAFAYRGKRIDVREASRELGARYLVEGSARLEGSGARVNVQLVDGRSGQHVWADRFDAGRTQVLEVQDEIVDRIVSALAPALSRIEQMRALHKAVEDLSAWESLQRGLFYLARQRLRDPEAARPELARAVEIEPGLAPGWAALAELDVLEVIWVTAPDPRRSIARAAEAATRAVELDPMDAAGHAALAAARWLAGDSQQALGRFEQALELNPSGSRAAFGLGLCFTRAPLDLARASELLALAARLSPRDPQAHQFLGWLGLIHCYEGRHDEAVAAFRRSIQLEPSQVFSFRPALVAALAYQGELAEAQRLRDEILAVGGVLHPRVRSARASDPLTRHMVQGLRMAGWPDL